MNCLNSGSVVTPQQRHANKFHAEAISARVAVNWQLILCSLLILLLISDDWFSVERELLFQMCCFAKDNFLVLVIDLKSSFPLVRGSAHDNNTRSTHYVAQFALS